MAFMRSAYINKSFAMKGLLMSRRKNPVVNDGGNNIE
jgi:hypothetical protein